jgi:serine protease Do
MEPNNAPQPRKSQFWPLFTTAICSALVGVLIACLILSIFFKGNGDTANPAVSPDPANPGQTTINLDKYENPAVAVAQKCMDTVVYIEVTQVSTIGKYAGREQVSGTGSGVIISAEGHIVTNNHVVDGAKGIYVTLNDGTRMKASLIGVDSSSDLAVVKIEKSGLHVAEMGSSDSLRVGEMAVAIGNPFGSQLGNSQSVGYISALNREINTDGVTISYIQTDAAINPGNSGGGLFNAKGELIGINTLKSRISGYDQYGNAISSEGIGFAIPIDYAKGIIDDLIQHGKISRPGIGVVVYTITPENAEISGTPAGVVVDRVVVGGPASLAGIKAQDIILQVDGEDVADNDAFLNAIKSKSIGDKVVLKIKREDAQLEVSVTVGDMSEMSYE